MFNYSVIGKMAANTIPDMAVPAKNMRARLAQLRVCFDFLTMPILLRREPYALHHQLPD
jgi:hypothetical protein